MATPKSYEIVACEHAPTEGNCRLCGAYVGGDCEGLKTYRFVCDHHASSQRYLRALRNKNNKAQPRLEKAHSAEAAHDFLQTIVDKFEFSGETLALGLYLYNVLLEADRTDYRTQMEFYASVCLMIGAKAIELDKRIPYYSRFVKYACREHSKDEYEKTEVKLMEEFEWNLQRPTFVTFLNFYLSNGVVFVDDQFSRKKVFLVEEKVKEIMHRWLRTGEFALCNQEKLAAQIVDEARKEFKLDWHRCLEAYSGLTVDMFRQADVLKPVNDLQTPLRSYKPMITPSTEQSKDTAASNHKEFSSQLKAKTKPNILRPIIPHSQLKYVPSFTALNLLSLKRTESSTN